MQAVQQTRREFHSIFTEFSPWVYTTEPQCPAFTGSMDEVTSRQKLGASVRLELIYFLIPVLTDLLF